MSTKKGIQTSNAKPAMPKRQNLKTKTVIQSLAHELWLEKRAILGEAEVAWLVDGRLRDQLDGLTNEQVLRVKRVLLATKKVATRRMAVGAV